jgi:hypothetical protein
MHRSGTSWVAHMLHRAGLFLGDRLMNGPDASNPAGHWENLDVVAVNDRILELSGGAWDRVPAALRLDGETAGRMRALLAGLRPHPAAGWKDPRTILTLPAWKPLLSAYRLVACLRHPLAVARSLQVREGWDLERGLRLWAAYNERLLEHARGEPAVCWFNYDLPGRRRAAAARALCRRLGLDPAGAADCFNPFLRHHAVVEPPADRYVRALYEELLAAAQAQALPAGTRRAGRGRRRDAQIIRLAEVVTLQSRVQQQLSARLEHLERHGERRHQELFGELLTLRAALQGLVAAVPAPARAGRWRDWPPLRLARRLLARWVPPRRRRGPT